MIGKTVSYLFRWYILCLKGSDGRLPVWYVMDEFGSRIQHSDNPTVRTVPFMYAPTQMAYTIMWPLQDLDSEGKTKLVF